MSSSASLPSAFSRYPSRLQRAIVSRLGWTSLRPVQELASHAILDGNNAVVLAPTAGGKTEASMFPLLASLVDNEPIGLGALYIAPIKALLNNQAERLGMYTQMVGLRRFLWHGDVKQAARNQFVREPDTLLMTTPESLEVMLISNKVDHKKLFQELRFVVIDEVHALAGSDRGAHLMSVIERIACYCPNDIQRIGLSATVGNPGDILRWLTGSSRRQGVVIDPPKAPSPKDLRIHYSEDLDAIADLVAKQSRGKKSLFFCQSRSLTEQIADKLRGYEFDVFVHHSSVSLEERGRAEARFHSGKNAVIACTSTLELGIDVGDLDQVLQMECPSTVSSFLQRLGRTGRRAGTTANTTFFCQEPMSVLQATALIELARARWVENVKVNLRCWPVLVHQIMALTLQFGAVEKDLIWQELQRVPDFSGIERQEFEALIAYMEREDFLFFSAGRLSLGTKAERTFGKRNFMEMYAVFSSPKLYRVLTAAGRELGSLEQAFVDTLVEGMSTFLLGGKAWLAKQIDHATRSIVCQLVAQGKKPRWGNYLPQFLGHQLCQKMAELLCDCGDPPGYLTAQAKEAFLSLKAQFQEHLQNGYWYSQIVDNSVIVWNFAGGAVNHTLKYALAILLPSVSVGVENLHLKISLGEENMNSLKEAFMRLANPETWVTIMPKLASCMPNYRLSKFQEALPANYSQETVKSYLLDVDTACMLMQRVFAG